MFGGQLTPAQLGMSFANRPELIWLAIGTALMFLGTVYFIARGATEDDPRARRFYVVTTLVPAIAFASYLSMTLGFGVTEVSLVTGEVLDIYWARYADWLFTTPLLLLDLGLLADADTETLFGAVAADAFMVVTGLVASLSRVPAYRYVWWAVSTAAFLFVLYFLYVTLSRKARDLDPETESTFMVLRNLTLVLWTVYPIWWLLGTEGAGVVPLYVETLGFMILDVLAKVGFGFVLLRSRSIMGDARAPEPSGS